MVTVLVTGSTDGIGRQTALDLIGSGHRVVVHARSDQRAKQVRAAVPEVAGVVVGDLASLAETRAVAEAAEGLTHYDVIIHNAGVGGGEKRRVTKDGFEHIFQVNVLAPYLLTCLTCARASGLPRLGPGGPGKSAPRRPRV
jgi:NAD(P)-dependent dehydrogenase (short-subunit alcohol dehydrogenase family)